MGSFCQDRRGFKFYMNLGVVISVFGLFFLLFSSSWALCLFLIFFGLLTFKTAEVLSRPPTNNPVEFARFFQNGTYDRRSPVLMLLGDSLTHGQCSGNFTLSLVPKLSLKLKYKIPDGSAEDSGDESKPIGARKRETFEKPLWVVNAGQNYLTTWGALNERLQSINDCYPDYILLFLGTDEILSMSSPWKKGSMMKLWNIKNGNNELSMENFEKNFAEILEFIVQASPMTQIGICSIPPIGENLTHPINRLVKQANSIIYNVTNNYDDRLVSVLPIYDKIQDTLMAKQRSWNNIPVEYSGLACVLLAPFKHFCGISYNTLSKLFSHDIYVDGVHFNEKGRDCVSDLIVQWLLDRNIQKAIAVKSF